MIKNRRFIIGIDLGTTNSAVGYVDLLDSTPGAIEIKTFLIPQLVRERVVEPSATLPSFLYLAGEYEISPDALNLPWNSKTDYAVGIFARSQGALVPDRLVSSAKSWLCHTKVDRKAHILPWGATDEVKKVSPVEATSRYLLHIKQAWDSLMPEPFDCQEVVVTVPASFDEVARELTLEAAKMAGYQDITLLEEPLAAFYAWLSAHEKDWENYIAAGENILVCDVGGGTTDFTMISCSKTDTGLALERIAVGDHLLLGGDNIDMALTTIAEKKFGRHLDQMRWRSLFHQCRQAKELLLSEEKSNDSNEQEVALRLTGTGRGLIAGTLVTALTKNEVLAPVMEDFFPFTPFSSSLHESEGCSGTRETGLMLEKDHAVTRHMARFVLKQCKGKTPDHLFFNGGTLKPAAVRSQLVKVVSKWAEKEVKALETASLDLAISLGAAYYGLVRQGLGLRVGAGIARSYYVGLRTDSAHRKAVCLVERGAQEGVEMEIERDFKVMTNQPVKFTIYSSTLRTQDKEGDIVDVMPDEMAEIAPLQTMLQYGKKNEAKPIAIRLCSKVTEIGTLELFCRSQESQHRWRLQFQLRQEDAPSPKPQEEVEGVRVVRRSDEDKTLDESREKITAEDRVFLEKARFIVQNCFEKDEISPASLMSLLLEASGMEKELWHISLLRGLFDLLVEQRRFCAKSPEHEARWLNLAGFCLRPGAGHPLDQWRIKKIWPFIFNGLFHAKDQQARLQWWIFWRRAAAGLSSGQQAQVAAPLRQTLLAGAAKAKGKKIKIERVSTAERREMWLLAANLERLEVESKCELGETALAELRKNQDWPAGAWVVGRFGAREPVYGPLNKVVSAKEAVLWLKELKKMEKLPLKNLLQPVLNMTRATGDRLRDIPAHGREAIFEWLISLGAKEQTILPLKQVVEMDGFSKSQSYGESLPEGIMLANEELK